MKESMMVTLAKKNDWSEGRNTGRTRGKEMEDKE